MTHDEEMKLRALSLEYEHAVDAHNVVWNHAPRGNAAERAEYTVDLAIVSAARARALNALEKAKKKAGL